MVSTRCTCRGFYVGSIVGSMLSNPHSMYPSGLAMNVGLVRADHKWLREAHKLLAIVDGSRKEATVLWLLSNAVELIHANLFSVVTSLWPSARTRSDQDVQLAFAHVALDSAEITLSHYEYLCQLRPSFVHRPASLYILLALILLVWLHSCSYSHWAKTSYGVSSGCPGSCALAG